MLYNHKLVGRSGDLIHVHLNSGETCYIEVVSAAAWGYADKYPLILRSGERYNATLHGGARDFFEAYTIRNAGGLLVNVAYESLKHAREGIDVMQAVWAWQEQDNGIGA
jgi:hypothetical protein